MHRGIGAAVFAKMVPLFSGGPPKTIDPSLHVSNFIWLNLARTLSQAGFSDYLIVSLCDRDINLKFQSQQH